MNSNNIWNYTVWDLKVSLQVSFQLIEYFRWKDTNLEKKKHSRERKNPTVSNCYRIIYIYIHALQANKNPGWKQLKLNLQSIYTKGRGGDLSPGTLLYIYIYINRNIESRKAKKKKKIIKIENKKREKWEANPPRYSIAIYNRVAAEKRRGEERRGRRTGFHQKKKRFVKKERGSRVCASTRACAGAAYVISDPMGDPGIRSHHTGLSTPTTVRTGLHYAFSNDPGCTTLSQIIAARHGRSRIARGGLPYVLSRVAEVMAGYVAAELFLALPRLERERRERERGKG